MLWAYHIPLFFFLMFRYVPYMPAFWRVFFFFYHKCMLNLSKAFSASIWFLSFNLLLWCITLIDLWILKNPCVPGIKPSWSWCMIFLICCWILFATIFVKDFCFYVQKWYWPVVLFFCGIFVWFWCHDGAGLIEWAGKCSFLCSFGA